MAGIANQYANRVISKEMQSGHVSRSHSGRPHALLWRVHRLARPEAGFAPAASGAKKPGGA